MSKRTDTSKPVSVYTPEQIAERAAREAALDTALTYAEQRLVRAREFAERLRPGRVIVGRVCGLDDGFSVMFGTTPHMLLGMSGPGTVELEITTEALGFRGSDALAGRVPRLRFRPNAYSFDSNAGLAACAEQGAAMVEAAAFGTTLCALLEDGRLQGPAPRCEDS